MARTRAIFLFLVALFCPSLAFADSFHELGSVTTFQSRDHAYRLRTPSKPWQRAEVGGLGGPSLKIGDKVWTFFDNRLHSTSDGLSYEPASGIPLITTPLFIQRGDFTILVGNVGGLLKMWILQNDWVEVGGVPDISAITPQQVGVTNGTLSLAAVEAGYLKNYRLVAGRWEVSSSVGCSAAARYTEAPLISAFCLDGRSWVLNSFGVWEELQGELIDFLAASDRIILVRESLTPSLLHLYDGTTEQTITLSGSELPDRYFVADNRVLVSFPTLGLYELAWQRTPVELILITPSFTNVVDVASPSVDAVFVTHGTTAYFSAAGTWQLVTTLGDFNQARQVGGGWWVWQTNETLTAGGLAQFLGEGQTNFVKVNPWASTTSPIQATSLGQLPAYVSVLTNSGNGNVNLYRSTNYTTWSRITLPNVPTLVRSISEVRLLPVGSLVETRGVVSAPSGVYSPEVIYIQDATAGIQIFLSSTKGALAVPLHTQTTVTGEVSSSQTKRVVLEAADDILSGGASNPAAVVPIKNSEIDTYQGRLVELRDVITELTTEDLTLEPELRIHFNFLSQNIKNLFQPQDLISVVAVADWNSSTDQTEAWYFGRGYSILQRNPTSNTKNPTTSAKSSSKKSVTTTSAKANQRVTSIPAKVSATKTRSASKPLVQGVQSSAMQGASLAGGRKELPMMVLVFLGIITGMLAIQGRRFQKLLH